MPQTIDCRFPRRRGDGPFIRCSKVSRSSCVSPAGAGMDPSTGGRMRIDKHYWFPPQARGWTAGTLFASLDTPARWFPPQARGWTLWTLEKKRPMVVQFPPQARGWTLDTGDLTSRPAARFPRRRGDGPLTRSAMWSMWTFPPQARGWTRCRSTPAHHRNVSPAGAGMDRLSMKGSRPGLGFPRRRGDGPWGECIKSQTWPFPPQARGWTLPLLPTPPFGPVSPAGAGMDRDISH